MTGIYLTDCFTELKPDEQRSIQKRLKIILQQNNVADRSRRTIQSALHRLGRPIDILDDMEQDSRRVFHRILDSCGLLSSDDLNAEEKEHLCKNPFVVRLNDGTRTIYGEALEFFAQDQNFRRQGYLFSYVKHLPIREKKSWMRWLQSGEDAKGTAPDHRRLYWHLAEQQCRLFENVESDVDFFQALDTQSVYLDDFFPGDPVHFPVAWFYRGVLPLYKSLSLMEKEIDMAKDIDSKFQKIPEGSIPTKKQISDHTRMKRILNALKCGRIVVVREPAPFGGPNRYRLVASREKATGHLAYHHELYQSEEEKREKLLF